VSGAAAATAVTARTTEEAVAVIEAASTPEDLFGPDAGRCYRRLARLTHPDTCPGNARAGAAFARLASLWRRYQDGLGMGVLVTRGDLANLYTDRHGLLKLARDPSDNDLMDREAAALSTIRLRAGSQFAAYFPELIAIRRVTDPRSGAQRRGNVLRDLDGFSTLAQVRAAYPGGVDPRDAAWMWRRLLVAIGAAHRAGLVHGAILPEHVLIEPGQHGLVLADWCYSGPAGGRLPALVGRYADWYPADVAAGQPAGQDTDIWLATGCLTELMGDQMPRPLALFARGCTLAHRQRRPQDAWQLLAELDELLGRLYGPRRFRPFAIPA
jgi:hypothetical protein